MVRIKRAIIIHGPGRSGTSLFNNLLSLHQDISWISGYVNRFPGWPILTYFNRLQSINEFEQLTRGRRYFPRPAEAYNFWDYYAGSVSHYNPDDIDALGDLRKLLKVLQRVMRYHGKYRLMIKLTGLARSALIERIFEDPVILYLDRDPRDIIVSYFRQRWLYKGDPNFAEIPREKLLREYIDLYMRFYNSKSELKRFDFNELQYENLVDKPADFFAKVLDAVELDHTDQFYDKIRSWKITREGIGRWKSFFDDEELARLNAGLIEPLRQLGY